MKKYFWKIRKKIQEEYGSIREFSKEYGKTESTVCKKLNGTSEWTLEEVGNVCKLLHIPLEKAGEYFFCD